MAGIWTDLSRTKNLTTNGTGIAFGIYSSGSSYSDKMTPDELNYDYPNTNRSGNHAKREIEALKNAMRFEVPIFVVSPSQDQRLREIRLGWVESFSDDAQMFLIKFGEAKDEFYSSNSFRVLKKKVQDLAGVEFKLKDFCPTFATQTAELNPNLIPDISSQLGHSSIVTTQR